MARYQLPALFLSASLAAVPAPTAAFIFISPLSLLSTSSSLSSSSSSSCHRQVIIALHCSNSNNDSSGSSSNNSSNDDSLNSSNNFYNDFEEDLFTSSSMPSASANANKKPDRPSISKSSIAADYDYDSSFFESLQKRQAQLGKSQRTLC